MTFSRSVALIATGGTIDKVYSRQGELAIGPPAAAWLLETGGAAGEVSVESVLTKDSLVLTEEDRAELAERVSRVEAGGVVITHGTDTMTETAEYLLHRQAARAGVTVVLTGALQPAAMRESDAAFNLGAAVLAARTLPAGIYVVMHGLVFPAGTVRKDRSLGRFVPLDEVPTA